MKSEKKASVSRSRYLLSFMIVFILVFIIAVASGFYKTEYDKKPIVKEKLEQGDADYLYNFYFSNTPNINGYDYVGDDSAQITVIMYSDFNSDASKYFYEEIYPSLEYDYIKTGKLKLYIKPYLTRDDYEQKNENFIYAKTFLCYNSVFDDNSALALLNTPLSSFLDSNVKTSLDDFESCISTQEDEKLIEIISEVENFGIVGVLPRLYIGLHGKGNKIIEGLPSYTRLKRTMRDFQMTLGD